MYHYLVGLGTVSVATDHKPLVPPIKAKDLSQTPLQCHRMLTRLMRLNVKAKYVPGKEVLVADTLPCSPVSTNKDTGQDQKRL